MIKRFLLFSSGCDIETLLKCPVSEVNRYVGIGASVCFTTIFAMIASGYALYQVFNTVLYAVIFAALWGLMIFNLDRFIVGSMQKSQSRFGELLSALPRVAIAFVISLVITKPLEVRLYSDRIVDEMDHQRIISTQSKAEKLRNIRGLPEMQQNVSNYDADYQVANTNSQQEPTDENYRLLKDQANKAQTEWTNLKNRLTPKINNLSVQYDALWNNTANYQVQDGKRIFDVGVRDRLNRIKKELDAYKAQVSTARNNATSLNKQVTDQKNKYQADERARAASLATARANARVKLDTAISETNAQITVADQNSKIGFSENFISQIDALGSLTAWHEDQYDDKGQIIERGNNTLYYTDRLLILLFLLVEIAPIITKLLAKKGIYDELLSAEEELQKTSIKLDLQSQLQMLQMNNDQIIELDLHNNNSLKDKILSAQAEIAEKVVSNWKQAQLAKLDQEAAASTP